MFCKICDRRLSGEKNNIYKLLILQKFTVKHRKLFKINRRHRIHCLKMRAFSGEKHFFTAIHRNSYNISLTKTTNRTTVKVGKNSQNYC